MGQAKCQEVPSAIMAFSQSTHKSMGYHQSLPGESGIQPEYPEVQGFFSESLRREWLSAGVPTSAGGVLIVSQGRMPFSHSTHKPSGYPQSLSGESGIEPE
jgi:hypothetical protein